MATDSELRGRIREMMCESDPDEVTVGSLYRKLEATYGVDFSNKKAFVRREFAGFLINYLQCDDDYGEGDDSPAVNKRLKSKSKEYDYKVGVVDEELAGVKGEEDVAKDQSTGKGTQNWRKRVAKMENEVMDERDASQVITSCSPAERKQVGEEGAGSGDLPKMSCRPRETDKSDNYRKREEEFAEAIRRSKIPVPISEALMDFFGIKENRMLEREAAVGVWDYILDKDLVATDENGDEPIGTVYCDEKLKKLFKVDTFHGFELPLHVIKHLLKRALED